MLKALAEITRFVDRVSMMTDGTLSPGVSLRVIGTGQYMASCFAMSITAPKNAFHLSRPSATLVTFLLSACAHELIMLYIFRRLRGYLLMLQMLQLLLAPLSRTRYYEDKGH